MRNKGYKKITFIHYPIPQNGNINEELQWIGFSLGLFNLRDKDKSMFRIFLELLKAAKVNMPISSDEVADSLKLTRGTVIHHINKLMGHGLVVSNNNRYIMRVDNLSQLIDELKRDVNNICSELKVVADDLDKKLGL